MHATHALVTNRACGFHARRIGNADRSPVTHACMPPQVRDSAHQRPSWRFFMEGPSGSGLTVVNRRLGFETEEEEDNVQVQLLPEETEGSWAEAAEMHV